MPCSSRSCTYSSASITKEFTLAQRGCLLLFHLRSRSVSSAPSSSTQRSTSHLGCEYCTDNLSNTGVGSCHFFSLRKLRRTPLTSPCTPLWPKRPASLTAS